MANKHKYWNYGTNVPNRGNATKSHLTPKDDMPKRNGSRSHEQPSRTAPSKVESIVDIGLIDTESSIEYRAASLIDIAGSTIPAGATLLREKYNSPTRDYFGNALIEFLGKK